MARPVRAACANRVVLQDRFSATGSASPRDRATSIAAQKETAPETTRMLTITRAKPAAMARPARAAHASRDVLPGRSSATVSASPREQITCTAAHPGIARAIIKARLVMTAPRARAVYASRVVLPGRSCATANVLHQARITCTAALLVIARAIIKARLAMTVLRARAVYANRDASRGRFSATANASPRELITYIAALQATAKTQTKAKPAVTVHPANRAPASRDASRGRSSATANASPRELITSIAALQATAKAQTKVRLAVTAHPARAALASGDASQVRFSAMVSASPREPITSTAALLAHARA